MTNSVNSSASAQNFAVKLPVTEKTGYSLGDAASNLYFQMFMSFYPAIFCVIGGLLIVFYPLKSSVMLKIKYDLSKRRAEV
ncbi:MAG: hypothetical protein PVG39_17260 [Desulfobacteraceae bacterium]|jgi:Na+/melibiose symporter-like transporter